MSEYATIEHYVNHVMAEITKRDVEQVSEKLCALGWEEVVRCRDCRHSRKDGTLCMFFASWEPIAGGDEYAEMPAIVEPGGYCAWGIKRKEVGE